MAIFMFSNNNGVRYVKILKILQCKINEKFTMYAEVFPPEYFFRPYAKEGEKIFRDNTDINDNLVTLHLWESYTKQYIDNIKDYGWIEDNKNTLYSKIVIANISKNDI